MRDWVEADFPVVGGWERPGAAVGALVFAHDAEGRLLMQLRDDRPGVVHAGLWGPFGGEVEAGETLAQAAVREFAEETGLALDPAALRPLARVVSDSARRTRLIAFETPMPAPPQAVRLGEGACFGLLTTAQLERFALAPTLRPMALALSRRLAGAAQRAAPYGDGAAAPGG